MGQVWQQQMGKWLTSPAGAGLAGAAGVVFEDGLAATGGFAAVFEVFLTTDCWNCWLLKLAG